MKALAFLSIFIICMYLSCLPLSAKDLTELKKYFLFTSIILFTIGVIGQICEKTSTESSVILGLFILMLSTIFVTSSIKTLRLKEPDYPIAIAAYCFLMYALSSVIVNFLIWSGIINEVQKNTGG